jgi:hypothetical protein
LIFPSRALYRSLKGYLILETGFSLISKNGSSNELKHQTKKIENLSPGIIFKSEYLFFGKKYS